MKQMVFLESDKSGLIQIANIKGGVGKTTVATNLAACFARRGPTLIIDLDVQGSTTVAFGYNPSSFDKCSYDLLAKRYYENSKIKQNRLLNLLTKARTAVKRFFLGAFEDEAEITSLVVCIDQGLGLIPANSKLFMNISEKQIGNLIFNLDVCKKYYKYVIIDTPSIWNTLIQKLYVYADLNLIPVTLNALSTKSLKDYLAEIKKLKLKKPNIKIRIVKNEVFGNEKSKLHGKTITTHTNRQFLSSLFQMQQNSGKHSNIFTPESIVMNLEIPETSIIRNAQDRGISAMKIVSYSAVRKAFERLTDNIQYIFNHELKNITGFWDFLKSPDLNRLFAGILRFSLLAFILFSANSLWNTPIPPVKTPSQLEKTGQPVISHVFKNGESIYRFSKYVIAKYRALVPTPTMIDNYLIETLKIHNYTHPGSQHIYNLNQIKSGVRINFYPPECIQNPSYKFDIPVYNYFMSLVKADFPYITGVWGYYGSGGDSPHTGIDVAAPLGSKIIAPISGIALHSESKNAGKVILIEAEDYVVMFAHCEKRYIKSGDYVKKGQAIAEIGMTGRSNGPHVHIGYGIKFPGRGRGINAYRFTDPKNLFFRQVYKNNYKKETLADINKFTASQSY
ncbi:MAG: AAA family ATPase [bacterium]